MEASESGRITGEATRVLSPRFVILDRSPQSLRQKGSLKLKPDGTWIGRWREDANTVDGRVVRIRRSLALGTLVSLPTEAMARRQLAFHVRDAKKLREKIQAKAVGAVRRRDELSGETSPIRLYRAKVDQLMRKYRLTPEMFEELKRQQNGCCAICEQPTEKLVIDHDHSTMRRRALLCAHCNSGLGFFRDKPDVMRAAASYVESHNDNQQ